MVIGYVVVDRFLAAPQQLGKIHYRGLDRNPWSRIDDLMYAGKLPRHLVELRELSLADHIGNFSAGTIAQIDQAQALLDVSQSIAPSELISIQPVSNVAVTFEANGFDCYVDGYGSPLEQGIWTKPELFSDFEMLLNEWGLFRDTNSLTAYLAAYGDRAQQGNLEVMDFQVGTQIYEIKIVS